MYDELWYWLPGPTWFKACVCVALAVGIVIVLFTVVFPAIGPLLPGSEVVVGEAM